MSDVTEAMVAAGRACLRPQKPYEREITENELVTRIYTAMDEASLVQEGDLVEQMARALMASNYYAPRGTPDGELEWRRNGSRYTRDAQAAAAIVQERMERMVRDAYEEGVEDGIEWVGGDGEPQPQWIDSVARVELFRAALASPIKDENNGQ